MIDHHSIGEQKAFLRNEMKQKIKQLPVEDRLLASNRIFSDLEQKDYFIQQKTIMAYWSMPNEVNTHDFILKWYTEKTILLPRVKDDIMEVVEFTGPDCLVCQGSLKLYEPAGTAFSKIEEIGLVIVPGLAFDLIGRRLGRGKAYYDRFLRSIDAIRTAVCFSIQMTEQVPTEPHDLRVDHIISY